jgi:formiminotetrahydrofolate cyclodeaminase
MKLVEMKVNEYLDVLKSDAPAPGGGSASALAAAQGVGLVCMVCDLTLGKEKYAEYQEVCGEAKAKAADLYSKLVASIDKDTEAFNLVSAAFKMPKGTDEEKAARSKAIADGTLVATEVPFETMMFCAEGLKVTEMIVGKSNPNAASDLGVAALNLLSGVKGAWLNVLINLPGVKDEAQKEKFLAGKKTIVEAEALAARIYMEVSAML